MSERLLTARHVAERLQSNLTTVYAWAKQGTLPSYKLGTLVRFKAADVEAFLEARQRVAPPPPPPPRPPPAAPVDLDRAVELAKYTCGVTRRSGPRKGGTPNGSV